MTSLISFHLAKPNNPDKENSGANLFTQACPSILKNYLVGNLGNFTLTISDDYLLFAVLKWEIRSLTCQYPFQFSLGLAHSLAVFCYYYCMHLRIP